MADEVLEAGFVLSVEPGEEAAHLDCLNKFYPALCPHYKKVFSAQNEKRSDALAEAARKQRVIDGLFRDIDGLQIQTDSLLDGRPLPTALSRGRVYEALELYDANLPEPEGFLAGGVLCRGSLGIIAGRRGVGKTFLLLKLAAAIARGDSFGPYATRSGRVLIVSEEMADLELRQRLRLMYSREDVERFSPNIRIACKTGVKIDSENALRNMAQVVGEAGGCDILLIDALSDIKGKIRENDNDEMGAGARGIRDVVAVPLGLTVLVAHHMGRAKEDGSVNPRGASALEDAAADIIHLGRNRAGDGYVGKFEKVRHMSPPGDFGYSIRGGSGVSGTSEQVIIDVHEGPTEGTSEADEIKRVVAWLSTEGDASTKSVMMKMGWKKTMALYHLNQGRTLGLIERHTVAGEHVWCLPGSGSSGDVPF